MLFFNEQLYQQTRELKSGKCTLPVSLEELRRWVNEKYSINVLNIVFDSIENGPAKGRPRLNLIVDTAEDHKKMHKDPFALKRSYKETILKHFAKIVAARPGEKYDTDNVLLIVDDFSDEAMGHAARRFLKDDKDTIISQFKECNVWDVSGFSKSLVVFYLSAKDVPTNAANGFSERIKQKCFELVKRHDEFGYYRLDSFPLSFDSKENLDKNYEGSLFYYFR